MQNVSAKITKGIQLGTMLQCADNTGAKEMELMSVLKYRGVRRRLCRAGITDVIICAVKKGKEKMRHQIVHAVIVRQRKEYRRHDGIRIKFSDNAAVLVNPKTYEPIGTEIRSVIAKEVVEKYSAIGKIAYMIV